MNITVFIGCDFSGKEPYRTISGMVESFSDEKTGLRVYPVLSNTANKFLVQAFGESHPEIRNGALFDNGLRSHIQALIKNSDFSIFDVSDYKGLVVPSNDAPLEGLGKQYCLNVIHELGIASAVAGDVPRMDARFFFRKGLKPIEDISNLQGALPLTYDPYKTFNHLKEQLENNLAPLIWQRRTAAESEGS